MYFLHLGYDWSLCLAPSLLPYGVTSMSFRPGCHRPFRRSYCLRSLPLLSWVSLLFIVLVSVFSCFCYPPTLCFSIFSLQPSSLFDPSPCLYTAGAYCFMWKERDSNPRCPTLSSPPIRGSYPFSAAYPIVAFDHSAILPFLFRVLRYLRSILPYFTCSLLILPSSIIS